MVRSLTRNFLFRVLLVASTKAQSLSPRVGIGFPLAIYSMLTTMTSISISLPAKGGQAPTQRPDALPLITALLELPGTGIAALFLGAYSLWLRSIQYNRTANLRATATLAI